MNYYVSALCKIAIKFTLTLAFSALIYQTAFAYDPFEQRVNPNDLPTRPNNQSQFDISAPQQKNPTSFVAGFLNTLDHQMYDMAYYEFLSADFRQQLTLADFRSEIIRTMKLLEPGFSDRDPQSNRNLSARSRKFSGTSVRVNGLDRSGKFYNFTGIYEVGLVTESIMIEGSTEKGWKVIGYNFAPE